MKRAGSSSIAVARIAAFLATLAVALPARAVDPFEIQVYDGTIEDPGEASLQLHLNHFAGSTTRASDVQGQSHATLEPAFGLTPWWDVGGYLQSALMPDGSFRYAGVKLRSEIATKTGDFRFALNGEVSILPQEFDPDRWGAELRPIAAWDTRWFLFAVNPILTFSFRRASSENGPHLEPSVLAYGKFLQRYAAGIEYYAGLGPVGRIAPLAEQEQYVYLAGAVDVGGGCTLNLGLGHGFGDASDPFVAKGIVGCTVFGAP